MVRCSSASVDEVNATRAFVFRSDALRQGKMCAGTLISLNTFAVLDAGNTGENQIAHIGLKKLHKSIQKNTNMFFLDEIKIVEFDGS